MPLTEIGRRQQSPRPWRRPVTLKLSSVPSIARGRQRQSSADSVLYGQRNIRAKFRRGLTNIRAFVKSQLWQNDFPSTSPLGSPPALKSDFEFETQSVAHSEASAGTHATKIAFTSIRRRLSKRGLLDLQPGTIIVKHELRRPPSLYTMSSVQSDGTSLRHTTETPPTSEGTITAGSPSSILKYDKPSHGSRKQDSDIPVTNLPLLDPLSTRKLSTIPEMDKKLLTSVKTCEAAAAAKIFLETRFNNLLSGTNARQARGENLEQRLLTMRIPPYLKHRIRRA